MSVNDETRGAKSSAASEKQQQGLDRRRFLHRLSLALTGLAGVLGL